MILTMMNAILMDDVYFSRRIWQENKWNCLDQASIHIIKFTSRIRYIHEKRSTKEG